MARNDDPMHLQTVTGALNDILSQYPRIRPESIEAFAPVYYPIAMVEMQLQEQTFEDFETVQLAVLRVLALQITDPGLIAKTLGLSTGYVEKVMHLLTGFGHLNGTTLTPLGRESLQQCKKITLNETMQTFQMDALNGTLLKLPQTVTEKAVTQQEQTVGRIGHLRHLEGISEDVLRRQLEGDRGMDYIYHNADILHANVSGIRDVRFVEMRFAQSYLMKLAGHTVPIVFAKRYDKTKTKLRERFSWQPYSVSNPQVIQSFGFSEKTPISIAAANECLLQMQQMLTDARGRKDVTDEVVTTLGIAYGLDSAGLQLRTEGAHLAVSIGDMAFVSAKRSLLTLLRELYTKPRKLVTNGYLQGRLLSLRVTGPKLRFLGQLLEETPPQNRKDLESSLLTRFQDYRGDLLLADAMIRAIREA